MWQDPVSAAQCSSVLECNDRLTFCHLRKIPPTPRFTTVPLPPVASGDDTWDPGDFCRDTCCGDGDDDDDDDDRDDDFLAQEAEMSRSLATAKPEYIEYGARSRVSFLLPPPEIVLYTDRSDNSQAAQLPRVWGAATTELRTPRRRSCVSPRSARRWGYLQRKASSPPSRRVRQFVRMGDQG